MDQDFYMDKIKKWKEFQKIYEFTEFNLQRMNPDKGGMMPNVDDPQLSINAFDKHQNAILAASAKLNSIMATLSNSAALGALKSRLFLDSQKLNSLKVLRIFKNDDVRYDIYLEFVLGDKPYYGVLKDILGQAPKLSSEAFRDHELVLSREWIIKTRGIILKVIEKWLEPESGQYTCLKDDVNAVNMKTGNLSKINIGTKIEVRTTLDHKIIIKHEDDFYSLQNDSFVYFNYWFQKTTG
jgi:hypothetical protein